ncbi:uncharacterized protein LOC142198559 [Leptodactylus fuscus]|uniref:uncharacterized protein LOC142198559 n=1 Tax=Leptodactylus fuscus TaxID=238119 RepID=UPI003F4EB442
MLPKTEKKGKGTGGKPGDTSALKRFLKRYEGHCAQCQSSVSPTITRGLKKCIQDGSKYLKAILLELRGRTSYPFIKLEAVDCGIDMWSLERLGKAVQYSQLTSITLDHNKFQDEGIQCLIRGLEGNMKLVFLSLCYCNLGPSSGAVLGKLLVESAISELHLTGNYLQCSGAVDLITPVAEHVQKLTTERPPEEATSLAHQILEDVVVSFSLEPDIENRLKNFLQGNSAECSSAKITEIGWFSKNLSQEQSGIHTLISGQPAAMDRPTVSPDRSSEKGKRKKKGRKKKGKPTPIPGPWVSKLYLADNGIDARGKEGETGVLEFSQLLSSLIRYSEHLSELDMDDNCLGELPATDILEALMERNQQKLTKHRKHQPQCGRKSIKLNYRHRDISDITLDICT